MDTVIRNVLRSLSITGNYRGYIFVIAACKLILEDETRLHNIMSEVYAKIASLYHCELHSVERNMRTVIYVIWAKQRQRLCEIAGYTLSAPPTVSEFLSILTNYIRISAEARA